LLVGFGLFPAIGAAKTGRGKMSTSFAFELVASVPYSAGGLREKIVEIGIGMLLPDQPPALVRAVPKPVRGPDGVLWTLGYDGPGRLRGSHWEPFHIDPAEAAGLLSIAPLADGGLVTLAKAGDRNLLTRYGSDGKVVWHRSGAVDNKQLDLPSLRGDLQVSMLRDDHGGIFLPGNRITGQVARVQIEDGATPVTVDIGDYRTNGDDLFIAGGKLCRVQFDPKLNARVWIRRNLQTGEELRGTMEGAVASGKVLAALPDGGALIFDTDTAGLAWLGDGGKLAARLDLAGVVRTSDGIALAEREAGGLRVRQVRHGKEGAPLTLAPLGPAARLVEAVDGYRVLDGDQLITFDAKGHKKGAEEATPKRLVAVEGKLFLGAAAVEPDGAALLAGSDPHGVYFVRIRRN
jgi:hypothetical protein